MLTLSGLRVFHGPIEAVHGLDLEVGQGRCVALLGPNGAGKTSTLAAIAGIARYRGAVRFRDRDIAALAVEDRQRAGIALVPEGRRVFSSLTVHENLLMGAATRRDPAVRQDIAGWYDAFPVLGERRRQPAGTLSGGEQQMLAIARALMSRPKILLLDEPSLGLAPLVCEQIFRLVGELKDDGMTILLVEQNVRAALALADYAYLLNGGRVVSEGERAAFTGDAALMAELTGV